MNIPQLNADFGIADQLQIVEGKGGFPYIQVDNAHATATISLYSGQVLSFQPKSEPTDLLFVSEHAFYQSGKAIKGGIPICWPWFGPDPDGLGRPAHGFVRNRMWQLLASQVTAAGQTQVTLGLADSPDTQAVWPQAFKLTLSITVGPSLTLELGTHNLGDQPITISQALHTYFRVGDIAQVQVLGLEGNDYLDKTDQGIEKSQAGPVTIAQEVDRVYLNVTVPELMIADAKLGRTIHITSQGSKTAIVWNPWQDIAKSMADLADDDYLSFICVETANTAQDLVTVAPSTTSTLTVNYRVSR
jgi:glucose-6-phosphate 1-epimerase